VGTQRRAGELPLGEQATADHRVAHGAERTGPKSLMVPSLR
jgi:hypothetical protein